MCIYLILRTDEDHWGFFLGDLTRATGMKKWQEKNFPSYIEAEVHVTGLVLWFHLNFLGNISIKHIVTHTRGIRLTTRDWQT